MQDETTDRPTDTGMLGSDAENPGPGRDTRHTDPAATADADDPEATAAMSDIDPVRTRLGISRWLFTRGGRRGRSPSRP